MRGVPSAAECVLDSGSGAPARSEPGTHGRKPECAIGERARVRRQIGGGKDGRPCGYQDLSLHYCWRRSTTLPVTPLSEEEPQGVGIISEALRRRTLA